MDEIATVEDIKIAIGFVSAFVIPYVVSRLKDVTWPGIYKFLIVVGFSVLMGAAQSYVDGTLGANATLFRNITTVLASATTVYQVFFKHLGWEKYVNAKAALATQAGEQVNIEVAKISDKEAKVLLDPNQTPSIDVQVTKR